jgi:diazepam-binding inhibitor (GABA receptor modulator, acyl-CoA-binding protein)|uniref:acyl-CoA-binding protein n=1 Tax=Polaribacter sp. TaxID=1920175 RepID=UPI0040481DAE
MRNDLDIQFKEAYIKASRISQEDLAPDVMLKLYAYYKQATLGDNPFKNNETDLRSGFKLNAWIQLRGMSASEAKSEYIELVNNL